MKKIFILLLLLILFLSACGKADLNSDTQQGITNGENNKDIIASIKQERVNENKKILSKVSKRNKSKLITKSYTEEHIFKKSFLYRLYSPFYGYNPTMGMFDEYFGIKIECVRKVDNERYYCILKTKENGYAYCFFRGDSSELILYNSCYMKELLTKSQFDTLKIGDTIESVTKIDSAFLSLYNHYISVESTLTQLVHLLKDGLLIIEYENDVIKKIDFNKDFTYSENGIIYDYKIFKDDYPPQ